MKKTMRLFSLLVNSRGETIGKRSSRTIALRCIQDTKFRDMIGKVAIVEETSLPEISDIINQPRAALFGAARCVLMMSLIFGKLI